MLSGKNTLPYNCDRKLVWPGCTSRIQTEPIPFGTEATVYVWFMVQILYCKPRNNRCIRSSRVRLGFFAEIQNIILEQSIVLSNKACGPGCIYQLIYWPAGVRGGQAHFVFLMHGNGRGSAQKNLVYANLRCCHMSSLLASDKSMSKKMRSPTVCAIQFFHPSPWTLNRGLTP